MECPTCNESPVCEAHPEDPVLDEPCEKEEGADSSGILSKFPLSGHWAFDRCSSMDFHGVDKIHVILRPGLLRSGGMVVDIQLARNEGSDTVVTAYIDNFNEDSVSLSTHSSEMFLDGVGCSESEQ